ncbi:methyl-accepting chemotaxis protein [Seohaeicola zhoushanensis]|uniref:HAMP domain-containing protein n=1 Tax=Seohaeicola zhoushanensis TaxID=1569283 RepID=A0A8J3H085_9RHOB|nr:methyl-accepting chemotaxis protein [Seohaeicola zhoushanensis]GHF65702.1 hypothetical protein GCM10017056_41040 [Seohaeicola zhoushanensis]
MNPLSPLPMAVKLPMAILALILPVVIGIGLYRAAPWWDLVLAGGVAALVALAVSALVLWAALVPVRRIGRAMGEIAEGKDAAVVPGATRRDEIGQLARGLETLCQAAVVAEAARIEAAFQRGGFRNASAAMLMVDRDFNINFMNAAMVAVFNEKIEDFRKLTGVQQARDLIGLNMDRFHAVPARVREIVSRPENLPMRAVIKVGATYFSLMIAAIPDEAGGTAGLVLEWKNESKALRDATIIAALDANSVRIEITRAGRLGWANSFVCRRLGRQVEDLLDIEVDTIMTTPAKAGETAPRLSEIAQMREVVMREVVIRIDGREIRIDATLTPMNDPQGNPAGVVMVGADVTEERNTLEAANAERARNEREQAQVVENLRQGLTRLSEGDLTARIETAFATQYEQLRQDFNGATRRLEAAIGSIALSAGSIRSDTDSISAASQSLSKRTETQAATLEETAAALDSLTGSVRTTASDGAKPAEGDRPRLRAAG